MVAAGHTFTRPNDSDSLLDHVNFEPLLRYLETDSILALFASLLVERRVIFTADSLSTLSAAVQAAIAVRSYPLPYPSLYTSSPPPPHPLPSPLLVFFRVFWSALLILFFFIFICYFYVFLNRYYTLSYGSTSSSPSFRNPSFPSVAPLCLL